MAELISPKNKKGAPRIDLTPMVDLGFLLVTFFVMTSRLSAPSITDIHMPVDGPPTEIPDFTAMTIYLGDAHKIFYLTGRNAMNNEFDKLQQTSFKAKGIRAALIAHKISVKESIERGLKGSSRRDFPFIIIKAGKESEYSDLVDLLDELAISNMQNYALVDINDKEESIIKSQG